MTDTGSADARKNVFAGSLRSAGLDFNRPGVVAAFDAMLDKAGVPRATAEGLTTSDAGIQLIKRFEGLELRAYPDPGTGGKPWTIGIGTTVYPSGQANNENNGVYKANVRCAAGGATARLSAPLPWDDPELIIGTIGEDTLEIEQAGVTTGPVERMIVAPGQTAVSFGNNGANNSPFIGPSAGYYITRIDMPAPLELALRRDIARRHPSLTIGGL